MKLTAIKYPAAKALGLLTVRVRITGLPVMRARLWLGTKLFAFAGWISGAKCVIEVIGVNTPVAPEYDDEGAPIRADVNHPEWDWERTAFHDVILDGTVQTHVTAFDREAGWVERFRLKNGDIYSDGDNCATERVVGKVTVRRRLP